MTYNSRIAAVNPDEISTTDLSIDVNSNVVQSANITKKFIVSGSCVFGNASGDSVTLSDVSPEFECQGITFSASNVSADLRFNTNALCFDASTKRVGIGTTTPSSSLDVRGSTFIDATAIAGCDIGDILISPTLNRVALGGSLQETFTVSGDVKFGTSNNLYIDASTRRLGIGLTTPSTHLHIRDSIVSNKKIDSSAIILLESTGRNVAQIGSATYLQENCAGILFSAYDVNATTATRHVAIYGNWGNNSIGPGGPSPAAPNTPTINSLGFTYLRATTTNTPFYTSVDTRTIGFIRNNVGIADIFFTGQHRSLPSENDLQFYSDKIGLIVISDGTYCVPLVNESPNESISINESLPKVKLSNIRNDKKVFGVIADKEDIENKRHYSHGIFTSVFEKAPEDHRLIINSVGEGAIWVTNINGNLENGDYITSCEIPGYGMKQDTDLLMNYTVAKITCDCDFNLSSSVYKCEEFEFSGSTYRKAFVGCTYHCG